MASVNSLTGPLDRQKLGFTLMHEHIYVLSWSMRQAFPGWLDRTALIAAAVRELAAVHASGVDAIVDCTAINLGRDVAMMREVAERSEVHIIASSGLYWTEEPWLDRWEAGQIFDWLMQDLQSMEGTGVRPGIIKCGTDRFGITPLNEKLLRVTARLHCASGLPITTHSTVANRSGLDQLRLFADEGVDLKRVVIGHCGDTDDIAMLEAILIQGACIGMDRFRPVHPFPTEKRVKVIAELCRRGYAAQMVLGHDIDVASDFGKYRRPSLTNPDVAERVYCYVPDVVVPALRAAGVSEAHIRQITVENPRRILAG
jgi:phosphotriesterase-related protein